MTNPPKFLLDANVFMQAARGYYAFDIAPAFWQALIDHASKGSVLSIDRVRDEIELGKDDLANWASGNFHQWFASTRDNDVVEAYGKIMNWAQAQPRYSLAAKAEFAGVRNADPWLVAYAFAKERVVVTHEQPRPEAKRKIFIPDVCQAFGVPFVDTYAMLRALAVKLG